METDLTIGFSILALMEMICTIGGFFTDAGGDTTADHIAKWNGTSWEGLGEGLNGSFSKFSNLSLMETIFMLSAILLPLEMMLHTIILLNGMEIHGRNLDMGLIKRLVHLHFFMMN